MKYIARIHTDGKTHDELRETKSLAQVYILSTFVNGVEVEKDKFYPPSRIVYAEIIEVKDGN